MLLEAIRYKKNGEDVHRKCKNYPKPTRSRMSSLPHRHTHTRTMREKKNGKKQIDRVQASNPIFRLCRTLFARLFHYILLYYLPFASKDTLPAYRVRRPHTTQIYFIHFETSIRSFTQLFSPFVRSFVRYYREWNSVIYWLVTFSLRPAAHCTPRSGSHVMRGAAAISYSMSHPHSERVPAMVMVVVLLPVPLYVFKVSIQLAATVKQVLVGRWHRPHWIQGPQQVRNNTYIIII